MPKPTARRSSRKPTARRSTRRVRKKAPQASLAIAPVGYSSGLRIYPKKFVALMRYKIQYTLVTGTVDTWNNRHFWNMTSPYDPDTSGVGTTASLFTKLAAQYNHYEVLSSKINFTGKLRSGNAMMVKMTSSDDTVVTVDTVFKALNDTDTKVVTCDNYNPNFSISKTYNRAKVFQKTKFPATVGTATSNPVENHYVSLASSNHGYALPPGPIDGILEIVYKVQWSEQKENPDL